MLKGADAKTGAEMYARSANCVRLLEPLHPIV